VHTHLAPLGTLNKQQRELTAQTPGRRGNGRWAWQVGGVEAKTYHRLFVISNADMLHKVRRFVT